MTAAPTPSRPGTPTGDTHCLSPQRIPCTLRPAVAFLGRRSFLSAGGLFALLAPAALLAQTLSLTPASQDLGTVCVNAVPTASQTYPISGVGLSGTVTASATGNGRVSVDGGGSWHASVPVPQSGGTLTPSSLLARFETLAAGANSSTIILSGGGATDQTAELTATGLDAAPALTVGATPATVCDGGGGE